MAWSQNAGVHAAENELSETRMPIAPPEDFSPVMQGGLRFCRDEVSPLDLVGVETERPEKAAKHVADQEVREQLELPDAPPIAIEDLAELDANIRHLISPFENRSLRW